MSPAPSVARRFAQSVRASVRHVPWGHLDNRPFLRCMHGYGLCLWRLGHFDEAESVFNQMLWLNPSDNQGVRFLIDDVRARTTWEDRENE